MNAIKSIVEDRLNRFLAVMILTIFTLFAGLFVAGQVQVSARTQWVEGGVGTSTTPVFNEFYDVPFGIGDEADFVRVKPGDRTAGSNADYVDSLSDACAPGSEFTVRTHIHNGAAPNFNEGEGTAIARNTVVSMNVDKFNNAQKDFVFTSSVSASNAAGMTDTASLNCGDNVILELVPSSVEVYSKPLGINAAPDSSVNGSVKIGSRVLGSGDVYACWDDRVTIWYVVKIVEVVEPEEPVYSCDLLGLSLISDRKYKFTVNATAENGAVIDSYTYNFGDGNEETSSNNMIEHEYSSDGVYNSSATVNFTINGETVSRSGVDCEQTITIDPEVEYCKIANKEHLPVNDPDCAEVKTVVTVLPNTGAGSTIAGIFAAVAGFGAVAHRKLTLKRQ